MVDVLTFRDGKIAVKNAYLQFAGVAGGALSSAAARGA